MHRKIIGGVLLIPVTLLADFSYTTTTRFTGGAMAGMSRALGGLSKNMRKLTDGMTQTVALKGNRMATIDENSATIVDLDKETYTHVDFQRKTYSVISFAEMEAAMKKSMEKMKGKMKESEEKRQEASNQAEMDFKLDIKETGQRKSIAGIDTKEVVMLIQTIVKDKKSNQSGAMDMMNSIWVAEPGAVPGHKELDEFNKKLAMRMARGLAAGGNPMAGMQGMLDPKMMDAMRKAAEEAQKLQGVHVMQISKFGTQLDPATASQVSNPKDTPEGPTAGQVAGRAAENAAENQAEKQALGRLGGRLGGLGGLGGFGRRKKQKEEEPKPEERPAQQQAGAAGQAVLMEMVIEMGNFSNAPVGEDKVNVPAGFNEEVHPMKKALRE